MSRRRRGDGGSRLTISLQARPRHARVRELDYPRLAVTAPSGLSRLKSGIARCSYDPLGEGARDVAFDLGWASRSRRNAWRVITKRRSGVFAVIVAVRGTSSINAISPRKSPLPYV